MSDNAYVCFFFYQIAPWGFMARAVSSGVDPVGWGCRVTLTPAAVQMDAGPVIRLHTVTRVS